jgi:hypothetical protein
VKLFRAIRYAFRSLVLVGRFSDSPLAGSDLTIRRRPNARVLDEHLDDFVALSVAKWALYEKTLFVEFEVNALRNAPPPVRALIIFTSCAIEVPIYERTTKVAVPIPLTQRGPSVSLGLELANGHIVVERDPATRSLAADPAAALFNRFGAELHARPAGHVLELGSRARSGNEYRHIVPDDWQYTGVDVKQGPNVDVVADAHALGAAFAEPCFDAVFAVSVFEHLLMPWKVMLELNRVMKLDGLVFFATHQTYALHDEPWDFWRFSDQSWKALMNPATGFEVVETALGQPAHIVPNATNAATWAPHPQRAFLMSTVLGRKIGEPRVSWEADPSGIVETKYPK